MQLTWLFTTQPQALQAGRSIEVPLALPRRVEVWQYDVIGQETLADAVRRGEHDAREAAPAGPVDRDLTAQMWFAPGCSTCRCASWSSRMPTPSSTCSCSARRSRPPRERVRGRPSRAARAAGCVWCNANSRSSHEAPTMSEPLILTSTHGEGARRIGLAKLNRPKQLNALNDALMDELGAALLAFDADAGIGCIVVTGSEKAFAAGADIAAMAKYSYMDVLPQRVHHAQLGDDPPRAQAGDRGGGRLRARRRLRAGDDVRLHHRRRHARASASPRSRSASSPAPAARSGCRARWARARRWT